MGLDLGRLSYTVSGLRTRLDEVPKRVRVIIGVGVPVILVLLVVFISVVTSGGGGGAALEIADVPEPKSMGFLERVRTEVSSENRWSSVYVLAAGAADEERIIVKGSVSGPADLAALKSRIQQMSPPAPVDWQVAVMDTGG